MVRPGTGKQIIVPSIPHKEEGSPLIRLIGDEFANNAESSLYLLEDLTSAIAGGVLTNNGTVTFAFDEDHGHIVGSFDGSTDYLSRATEGQFEVGTGSFIGSVWFKTSTKTTAMALFGYGDGAASEQFYSIRFEGAGLITCAIDDGTNFVQVLDTIADRWQDDKWHNAQMFVDRTTNIMYLIIDGQQVNSGSISAVTLTLNNAGEDMRIGARKSVSVIEHFTGQLANFHIIKEADYNAVQVLNQGIRESISIGTHTITNDTLKRLNNQFNLGTTLNDYATTVIDVEEGVYELQTVYEQNTPSFGTLSIQIDGEELDSIVTLGTLADNSIAIETKIKLSAGKHILKIKNTLAGQISINWISLIKREGHEKGGVTKFLLLGDELIQRSNDGNSTRGVNTALFYNNIWERSIGDADDLDFDEGEIFLKGGLWKIDFIHRKNTDKGQADLDFGNVEVLDQFDTFNGTLQNNQVKSVNVRLNQGKNNIRLAANGKNGTSTDFVITVIAIRGERIND